MVVHEDSPLVGLAIDEVAGTEKFNAEILQLRRGAEVNTSPPPEEEQRKGDLLRINTDKETLVEDILSKEELVMAGEEGEGEVDVPEEEKVPHAVGVMLGVVVLASLGIFPNLLAALAVVAMGVTGVFKPHEVYDSVSWDVTFAASTAFLTPVGYQTNLFVYGPGGYRFSDYLWVGAPLQVILSVVTVAGIVFFWGL